MGTTAIFFPGWGGGGDFIIFPLLLCLEKHRIINVFGGGFAPPPAFTPIYWQFSEMSYPSPPPPIVEHWARCRWLNHSSTIANSLGPPDFLIPSISRGGWGLKKPQGESLGSYTTWMKGFGNKFKESKRKWLKAGLYIYKRAEVDICVFYRAFALRASSQSEWHQRKNGCHRKIVRVCGGQRQGEPLGNE